MQRKILSCFWKAGEKAPWGNTGKESKTKTALHQNLVIFKAKQKGKKKKKAFHVNMKSFSSQYKQFLQLIWPKCMQSQMKYLQWDSSDPFHIFILRSQCLQVSKVLENIPFHYPLHLFHLLRSELHWLCSLPAHSMCHLTFRLPNSPTHHIVAGYLLEHQHNWEVTESLKYQHATSVNNCNIQPTSNPEIQLSIYVFWTKKATHN